MKFSREAALAILSFTALASAQSQCDCNQQPTAQTITETTTETATVSAEKTGASGGGGAGETVTLISTVEAQTVTAAFTVTETQTYAFTAFSTITQSAPPGGSPTGHAVSDSPITASASPSGSPSGQAVSDSLITASASPSGSPTGQAMSDSPITESGSPAGQSPSDFPGGSGPSAPTTTAVVTGSISNSGIPGGPGALTSAFGEATSVVVATAPTGLNSIGGGGDGSEGIQTHEFTAFTTITESASSGSPTGQSGMSDSLGGNGPSTTTAVVTDGTGANGMGGGGNGSGGQGGGAGGGGGGIVAIGNSIPPYTAENNGRSTSCDYAEGKSTVFEYSAAAATATGSYTCDKAVYNGIEVIVNVVLDLEVTEMISDSSITIMTTVTKTSSTTPTVVPAQPPPPSSPSLIAPVLGNSTFLPNQTYHFPGTSNHTSPLTPLSISNSTTGTSNSTTGTSNSTTGTIHPIGVSNNGKFMYASNCLNATIGEYLQFEFQGTNTTVYETTHESPCSPISGGFQVGFNSTVSSSANTTVHIERQMQIKDDNARYFYCGFQSGECSTETVFAVNVKVEEWTTLQESLSGERRSAGPLRRSWPILMPKREPQIPGKRSLLWWS